MVHQLKTTGCYLKLVETTATKNKICNIPVLKKSHVHLKVSLWSSKGFREGFWEVLSNKTKIQLFGINFIRWFSKKRNCVWRTSSPLSSTEVETWFGAVFLLNVQDDITKVPNESDGWYHVLYTLKENVVPPPDEWVFQHDYDPKCSTGVFYF